MTGTAIAPVPARTLLLCPSKRFNTHPCNARPDLYPTGGPPLDAGLIHGEASDHLARFIRGRLQESGCEHPAVAKDALLHTNREERTHSGTWAYTRPSILAYKFLRADREPANAFHLGYDGPPDLVVEILSASTGCKDMGVGGDIADKTEYYRSVGVSEYWIYNPELRQQQKGIRFFTGYALQEGRYVPMQRRGNCWPSAVLGTMWEKGDRHCPARGAEYTLMRLRKPDTGAWYLTSDEATAALETVTAALKCVEAKAELKQKAKRLALYERKTGFLEE